MATSVFNDWIQQIPWNDRVTPHLKPCPKYKVTSFIDSKGASNTKVELWPTCKFYLTHDLVKGDGVPNFCGYILVPKGLKDKIATEDGDVSPVVGSSGLKRKVDSQKGDGPMKKAKLKKEQVTSTTDTISSRYTSFPVSGLMSSASSSSSKKSVVEPSIFKWAIEHFKDFTKFKVLPVYIEHSKYDCKLFLNCSPKHKHFTKKYFTLIFLTMGECDEDVLPVHYEISILDANGVKQHTREFKADFGKLNRKINSNADVQYRVSWDYLTNPANGLLVNGALLINFELYIPEAVPEQGFFRLCKSKNFRREKGPEDKLLSPLKSLPVVKSSWSAN